MPAPGDPVWETSREARRAEGSTIHWSEMLGVLAVACDAARRFERKKERKEKSKGQKKTN